MNKKKLFKRLWLNSILFFFALIALIFSQQLSISASTKFDVCVDYNLEDISRYLPTNVVNGLQNNVQKLSSGEGVTISPLMNTINCYYKCDWKCDGVSINIDNFVVTKDTTITANWTPIEYTIHYMYLNNEESQITNLQTTKTYTIEDGRIDYYRPTRNNYVFIDWYTSSTLNDQFLAIYKTEFGIGDIFLYAKWKPIEYKINYHTDGYNINNPPTYNVEHKGFDLASPTKEGYVFDGWYLDEDFTNKCTRIDSAFSGEINLYPKWNAKTYEVTFILPDGSVCKDTVEYGKDCPLPKLNNSIFEIVKTDVSRENITSDTTIKVEYVNIWYVYVIALLLAVGIALLIVFIIIRKRKSIHKLRYVYNTANKKTRGWK